MFGFVASFFFLHIYIFVHNVLSICYRAYIQCSKKSTAHIIHPLRTDYREHNYFFPLYRIRVIWNRGGKNHMKLLQNTYKYKYK